MVPSQDTGSSLRAIEDAERMRLAHVWLKLAEEARSQSNVLQEMEAVPVQQQVYLVLDGAPELCIDISRVGNYGLPTVDSMD